MNNDIKLILLVDDNEDDNFFHTRAIKNSGLTCQVDVCTSGDTALEYLTNQGVYAVKGETIPKPDLIFLDINMPRIDGWEFLRRYTKLVDDNVLSPSTVIVMLSTSVRLSDFEQAIVTQHVKQYVEKPLRPENILQIIKEHFPTAQN